METQDFGKKLIELRKSKGLTQGDVDLTLGIVKAPYMTRVGEGPFPTELGGIKSAEWCGTAGITKQTEKEKFHNIETQLLQKQLKLSVDSQFGFVETVIISSAIVTATAVAIISVVLVLNKSLNEVQ